MTTLVAEEAQSASKHQASNSGGQNTGAASSTRIDEAKFIRYGLGLSVLLIALDVAVYFTVI